MTQVPVWTPDIDTLDGFDRARLARLASFKSRLTVPVLSGRDVEAVLEFFSMDQREPELDRRYGFGVLVEEGGHCRDPGGETAGDRGGRWRDLFAGGNRACRLCICASHTRCGNPGRQIRPWI
jgi:hypothetical protein